MNLNEVKKILEENFHKKPAEGKKRNIVFWYDEEGEFVEDIDELNLANATLIKLSDNNVFYIKYLLEKKDLKSNYLIYSPAAKPLPRDNWLLDTLKYSMEFFTDKAVLIMLDLGAKDISLRNVFKKYLKFFNNKDRYKKFTSYHPNNLTEEKVDISVLAALGKLPVADFEQVVKRVLIGETEGENKYLEAINNYGDMEAFWNLVEKRYGYTLEEKSIEKLIIMLLITHLSYNLEENLPKTWQDYLSLKKSDCIVFVSNFMNHAVDGKDYNINFYKDNIAAFIRNDERVFVIVSDALRYEAGKELINLLNKEVRGTTEIDFMQGVTPSTTKFGMASLLPRQTLEYSDKAEVIVDGVNT